VNSLKGNGENQKQEYQDYAHQVNSAMSEIEERIYVSIEKSKF
jgi:hypothetical protein